VVFIGGVLVIPAKIVGFIEAVWRMKSVGKDVLLGLPKSHGRNALEKSFTDPNKSGVEYAVGECVHEGGVELSEISDDPVT